jgi:TonB-linked SusC/RagA family outer membrane protein
MRKIAMLIAVLFCSTVSVLAQNTINGKVTDSKTGTPLPGASVKVKGTSKGVVTNSEGLFTIESDKTVSLEISGVGFLPITIKASPGQTVSIDLDGDSKKLSEVVVTALGITRSKNTLPFSAQKVSASDVNQSRGSNFVNNLSGKVSGVEIRQNNVMGGSTNVVLRGSKSLTGNNQALFVVDGVPYSNANSNTGTQRIGGGGYDYGNAAADINPDDIDNITVLKGASASALYGSRGSNGVILVTTKKGRKGLGITVNTGFTQSSILRNTFPKYQKKYGAGYGSYFDAADINGDGTDDEVAPTYDDASWGTVFDAARQVYQWDAFDKNSLNFGKSTPWVAAANDPSTFFEKPISFNNSVFIETGNDKGSIALGYTRNDEKGVLPNSSIKKDLLNFSSTYKIAENLSVSAAANYTKTSGKGRFGTGYDGANALNLMTNFREWWQTNVDLKDLKRAYEAEQKNVTWNMSSATTGELNPIYWDNPYFTRNKSYQNDTRDRLFGNVAVNYKVASWLNIMGRVSMDQYTELQQERKALTSVGVSFYTRYNLGYKELNYDLLATADWNLKNDWNLKALVGSNTNIIKSTSVYSTTNGGLAFPDLYTIANSISAPPPPVEGQSTSRIEGVFGGATLTYKNTYTLDATYRRDRSSTLPEGNNKYNYYSVSGGFIFSELVKKDWLSYGKLRASYAEVGSSAPVYYVRDVYVNEVDGNSGQSVTSYDGSPLFSVSGTKNNPDLKPERTKSSEVGLEMSFLKSRIGFDLTYYSTKTVDQILPVTVSTATGYSRRIVNSGTVQNKGIELALYGTPVKTKDFQWEVNVNFTKNTNKVLELYTPNGAQKIDNIILGSFQGSITVNASLNEPYGTIHGTDYVYTNGQPTVGSDGNYLITPSNNNTIGNINPDWIGGVNNKLTFKGISLGFLIDVRKGGSVFSTDMYYALAGGLYEETAVNNDLGNPLRDPLTSDAKSGGLIRPGVTEDGKPNTIRASTENYGEFDSYVSSPDKRFVYDAGYIKLREVSIGYALPKSLFQGNFGKAFKGIDIAVVGRNLAILHKNLPYADPEDGFSSGNLQGIQTGSYPAVRNIAFNVKFRF